MEQKLRCKLINSHDGNIYVVAVKNNTIRMTHRVSMSDDLPDERLFVSSNSKEKKRLVFDDLCMNQVGKCCHELK